MQGRDATVSAELCFAGSHPHLQYAPKDGRAHTPRVGPGVGLGGRRPGSEVAAGRGGKLEPLLSLLQAN